ncbi:Uncharacterized protein Rs2_02711 [Raphanus sativus]|nr:Uncharacterized protein Rs2_02711 [Raphanus sativus]
MDPNQSGIPKQRTDDADPIGVEQRTLPIGSTNTSGINDPTQIPQAPPAGITASDRYGTRVWNRTGDRLPIDSSLTRTQPTRPISPMQITLVINTTPKSFTWRNRRNIRRGMLSYAIV